MNKLRQLQILLTKIPKGKVTTYGILAKKLKIHPRVVGKLLSKNIYLNKYPCYKVVLSSGKIGGYSIGLKNKIKRLRKDGIKIKNNKVNLKNYLFAFKR
ncbi:MAG: MGMT family protein [Candidatus Aenigmatarchaeota archaeon]